MTRLSFPFEGLSVSRVDSLPRVRGGNALIHVGTKVLQTTSRQSQTAPYGPVAVPYDLVTSEARECPLPLALHVKWRGLSLAICLPR